MADSIQARLPVELTPIVDEIKQARAEKMESTSTKSIIIDAIKTLHKKVCK